MKPDTNAREYIKHKLIILLGVAVYFILCMLTTGCPIKFLTGISCPGCGMTRAFFSLLHGDLAAAFHSHPLFFTAPFLFVYMMTEELLPRRLSRVLFICFSVLYLGVYIIRLIFIKNDIIAIDFGSGFVVQSIIKIFGGSS